MPFFYVTGNTYMYRPVPLPVDMYNLVRIFPIKVWALLAASLVAAGLTFELFRFCYSYLPEKKKLIVGKPSLGDMTLSLAATLTEPQGVGYFQAWSTGNHEKNPE